MCVCVCTPVLSASQERALRGLLFINRGGCGSLVISKGRQTTLSPFHHTGEQIERDGVGVCLRQANSSILAWMTLGTLSSEKPPL